MRGTESINIIISKGSPGSKQLSTLARLTPVAPFDQQRQQGFRQTRAHANRCLLTLHSLYVSTCMEMLVNCPNGRWTERTNTFSHTQTCVTTIRPYAALLQAISDSFEEEKEMNFGAMIHN